MTAATEEHFSVPLSGAMLQIPRAAAINAWLDANLRQPVQSASAIPPAIGSEWPGQRAIYAGVMRGQAGQPDYHLLVPTEPPEKTGINWADAMAWAKEAGFDLPNRQEARLLWANVPELFASEWYWLCTQFAGYERCAWIQHFGDGFQDDDHKGLVFRARPVRRLIL